MRPTRRRCLTHLEWAFILTQSGVFMAKKSTSKSSARRKSKAKPKRKPATVLWFKDSAARTRRVNAVTARLIEVTDGIAVAEVARKTSAHPENTRRYLGGESTPSLDFLIMFCRAFGVSGDWLLDGRGQRSRRGGKGS